MLPFKYLYIPVGKRALTYVVITFYAINMFKLMILLDASLRAENIQETEATFDCKLMLQTNNFLYKLKQGTQYTGLFSNFASTFKENIHELC